MNSYQATTGKEWDKTTTIICYAFAVGLMILGIIRRSPYPVAIGVVLFAAAAMSKTITVSEEGIVTEYRFLLYTKKEVWKWEDIIEIFCEYSSKQPVKVGLHFTKENLMARRLFFSRKYEDEIIDLALAQNPKIRIEED